MLTKRLIDHLAAIKPTYPKLSLPVPLTDFKKSKIAMDSGFPKLQPIGDGTWVKFGALKSSSEVIQMASFGSLLPLSGQVIWNDDIAAIDAVIRGAAQRCAADANLLFWNLVVRTGTGSVGPVCSDGNAYFSTAHGNLLAGGALTDVSLNAATAAMRGQVGLDGVTQLSIAPALLVAGPTLETAARKLLYSMGSELQLLVEPAIADGTFYTFADPTAHAAFVQGVLGDGTPSLVSRVGFDSYGLEFRLRLDVGFGPGDWRAATKTPPT